MNMKSSPVTSLASNPMVTHNSTVPSSRLTKRSSTGKCMTSPTSLLTKPFPNLPGSKLPPSTVPPSFSTSALLSNAEKKVSSAVAIETQSNIIVNIHKVFIKDSPISVRLWRQALCLLHRLRTKRCRIDSILDVDNTITVFR